MFTIYLAVLIPLFGLHFIISAFVPGDSYTPYNAKAAFDTIQAITTSFQVSLTLEVLYSHEF